MKDSIQYPVRLEVDYPEDLNRLTTVFRPVLAIPVLFLLLVLDGTLGGFSGYETDSAVVNINIVWSISLATGLMILFMLRYPRWWFDFQLEFSRFMGRIMAYMLLLTDLYPSTEDEQCYHLEIDYPDVKSDLNRFLPLVKWLLAIPHFIILTILWLLTIFAVIVAWFSILLTGTYPRDLFDFVVGTLRWSSRVFGYAILLVTDVYPPFSLK